MAFVKKTWKDRIVQYANRRLLTKSGGEVEQVTVTRDEGTISEAGDIFDAATMNDLEQRIDDGFDDVDTALSGKADTSTTCRYIQTTITWNANTNRFDIPSQSPRPVQPQQCLIGRNSSTGALYALWYVSTDQNFSLGAVLSGSAPTSGQTCYINYVIPNT